MGKLSLSEFKRNNFMLLCIVAVVAIMFIFIPEFIGVGTNGKAAFQDFSLEFPDVHKGTGAIHEEQAQQARVSNVQIDQQLVAQLQEQPSLERLITLIDNGYMDHLVRNRQNENDAAAGSDVRASLNPNAIPSLQSQEGMTAPLEKTPPPPGLEFLVQQQVVDWKNIKSRAARRVFARVEGQATQLLAQIPEESTQSRMALLNYISALSKIPASGDRVMTAKDAVDYLNQLDNQVTRAFTAENAPRAILHDWAAISLSSVLGRQRGDSVKEKIVPPFNPQPTAVRADFTLGTDRRGRPEYKTELFAVLKFIVTGNEIKNVEVYRDDRYFHKAKLKEVSKKKGNNQFYFETRRLQLPNKYTIVSYDKHGEMHKKHYYLSRPRRGKWKFNAGPGNYTLSFSKYDHPGVDKLVRNMGRKRDNGFGLTSRSQGSLQLVSSF